ncbi:class I SAM-dependent methyltransferase [Amycolatopsis australiensis]|uniref:Ubiquinone/menaquinone biosynthesis C-methylase UbiE n=1 Tax=Amycolatopsis australiensis TaxID=546364 RepID=A0A1K1RGJ2_9PSEU|nr:methyltransferase domain-containing protein [Amycolatopsis australiensis]SFW71141.1 Ubiquinone/menaquinone biosynthesis C-methylase UbiE [Amycolatopsis australiensis]
MPAQTATERLQRLLDTPAQPAQGFLDLLGEADQAGPPTGLTQRLMRTTLLPQVNERYWRPALGRALKGPFGPSMAGEVRLAAKLLALTPGDVVLDVACGTGRFTRAFGAAVAPDGLAIGLDGARTMLAKAVAEGAPDTVAYLRADAVHLPLKESTVDGICCFAALHMFAEPETALDSFARVLKPGGRIVLLTSARRGRQPVRLAESIGGALSGQRMFDRGEIAAGLRARGFTGISERYAGVTQIVAGRRS